MSASLVRTVAGWQLSAYLTVSAGLRSIQELVSHHADDAAAVVVVGIETDRGLLVRV